MSESASELIMLVGPTASGKTQISLELFRYFPLEIVSADSMQVYRGMNIGTAKPTPLELKSLPHHCIDLVSPHESFDVANYLRHAQGALEKIRARSKSPLVVGGTGLYIRALRYGLDDQVPSDQNLRAALELMSASELLKRLETYGAHDLNESDRMNKRRLIRAIEICEHTGQPLGQSRLAWKTKGRSGPLIFIERQMGDLHERIEKRVDEMFERGWVEEVESLLHGGIPETSTALKAIGYSQIISLIQGKVSLRECVADVKIKTKQFAKRQKTWFAKEKDVIKVIVEQNETPAQIARHIFQQIENYAQA